MTKEVKELIKALKGAVDTYQYTALDPWEQEVTVQARVFAEEVLAKYVCGVCIVCKDGEVCKEIHAK